MAKREFVMLAHKYDPKKHDVRGWFLSSKLDGIRAFYDGGITYGIPAAEIPWANVEKDARLKNISISTGLWSRYGKVIYAPKSWLEKLPTLFLDGELYIENNSWQKLSSVVKQHVPNEHDWNQVKFMTLDSPTIGKIFADGVINTTNFKKNFNNIKVWLDDLQDISLLGNISFEFIYDKLTFRMLENNNFKIHKQEKIPLRNSHEFINQRLDEIVESGGEGVVLRNPSSIWTPERSHNLLKYKPFNDDEGIVTGYIWGRKTELGSKLLGKMGALILDYKGKRLELSGFTHEEREIIYYDNLNLNVTLEQYYEEYAGEEIHTTYFKNNHFPIGSKVTFRYRELSDNGIPKEARYLRKHE